MQAHTVYMATTTDGGSSLLAFGRRGLVLALLRRLADTLSYRGLPALFKRQGKNGFYPRQHRTSMYSCLMVLSGVVREPRGKIITGERQEVYDLASTLPT